MRSVGHGFSKTLLCPSSEELLSFIARPYAKERRLLIAHVAECAFCDAEMWFLSKHPPPPVRMKSAVMPAHLRLLAQCLLSDFGLKELSQLND